MKNFLPIQYQFQSQKSFVAAEQTKEEASAISDSNSGSDGAVASSFVQQQRGTRFLDLRKYM